MSAAPTAAPMPDPSGWPDAAHPGVPADLHRPGPHLIADSRGRRRWVWWEPAAAGRVGGWLFVGGCGARTTWRYLGPAVAVDGKPVEGVDGRLPVAPIGRRERRGARSLVSGQLHGGVATDDRAGGR